MKKMEKNIWFAVGLCLIVSGCEGENAPQFNADEFVIQSTAFTEKLGAGLFLPPLSAQSSNEKVATVELTEESLVLRSAGRGSATVTVSDWRCENNAARIEVQVSETGRITAETYPFTGNLVKAIVKEAVSIAGAVGAEIDSRNVRLMMDGNDFIGIALDDDVSTWINNLPLGLTAKVNSIQAGEHIHELTLVVSGVPSTARTEPLSITIPAENTAINVSVNVDPHPNARFAID